MLSQRMHTYTHCGITACGSTATEKIVSLQFFIASFLFCLRKLSDAMISYPAWKRPYKALCGLAKALHVRRRPGMCKAF